MKRRSYSYVGPADIRAAAQDQPAGTSIGTADDLRRWLEGDPTDTHPAGGFVATFTIGTDEQLRLAPRRSEHVACASGGPVLAAGEITFDEGLEVLEISNQSTGFCPEPESWPVVGAVLDRVGLEHPGGFTQGVIFRLCPECGERNIVKDDWFYCQLCDGKLPEAWNFPE